MDPDWFRESDDSGRRGVWISTAGLEIYDHLVKVDDAEWNVKNKSFGTIPR